MKLEKILNELVEEVASQLVGYPGEKTVVKIALPETVVDALNRSFRPLGNAGVKGISVSKIAFDKGTVYIEKL